MKAPKLFLAVGFLFVFSLGVTFGQASNKNKQVVINSFYTTGKLPCAPDFVGGYEKLVFTSWDNKIQVRGDAIFVGLYSGKIYEWHLIDNMMFKDYIPGQAYQTNQVAIAEIYCDGEAIAVLKQLIHFTMNAKGELTADINIGSWSFECL
jgi:hypothetical protein